MAFLQFHVTHFAGLFLTPDTLTLTHSLYFLLVLIIVSTRSSLESFQNGMSYRRMFDPNHLHVVSFRSALLKLLDQSKIISEPWHSGSNGRNYVHRRIVIEERRRTPGPPFSQHQIILFGWTGTNVIVAPWQVRGHGESGARILLPTRQKKLSPSI